MYKKYIVILGFLMFLLCMGLASAGDGVTDWYYFDSYDASKMTWTNPSYMTNPIDTGAWYSHSCSGNNYMQFCDGNNATGLSNDKEISWVKLYFKPGRQNDAHTDSLRFLLNFGDPDTDNGTWSPVFILDDVMDDFPYYLTWDFTSGQANHSQRWTQTELEDLNIWANAYNRGSCVYLYIIKFQVYYLGYPEFTSIYAVNSTRMGLIFNKDDNSNNTYIERNTVSTWARGAGSEVYNGTIGANQDPSLTPGQLYYYQAWSYSNENNIFSGNSSISYGMTEPAPPTGGTFTAINSTAVNISWTKGTGANTSVLIKNNNNVPTSITDGTIVYNGSLNYYIEDDIASGDTAYYKIWSYADWVNPSYYEFSSEGTEIEVGGLTINCFDENTTAGLTFDVFISNEDGSEVYNESGITNPHFVNDTEIPTGDISIQISATGYYDRFYYLSGVQGGYYMINAFLPPVETGTELKAVNVAGPQTYFNTNPPIEDAIVTVSKYFNESVGFEPISVLNTDANGQCFLYLKNDEYYKVSITKTGYVTETSDITTADAIDSYTFRIYPEDYTSTEYFSFKEQVTFTAEMSGEYMQAGNITITFIDSNNTMLNTDIYIYETFGGTTTLKNHSHNTSNDFSYIVGGINTSRDHYIKLYFNSTVEFYDASPLDFIEFAIHILYSSRDKFDFDARVTGLIGPFVVNGVSISWAWILTFIISFGFLVLLGPYDTGLALIGCGLMIALTQGIFSLWFTHTFPAAMIALIPIFVIAGVVWYWAKGSGGEYV